MEPLIEAYQRGAKIASLEMRDIKDLSAVEFEQFLEHLLVDDGKDRIQASLKQLRFGSGWVSQLRVETSEILEEILDSEGCRISYIHTFNSVKGPEPRCRFNNKECRGMLIEDKAADSETRVGFLSTVLHQGSPGDRQQWHPTTWNQDLTEYIFSFIAPTTTHLIVVQEHDVEMNSYDPDDEDD